MFKTYFHETRSDNFNMSVFRQFDINTPSGVMGGASVQAVLFFDYTPSVSNKFNAMINKFGFM